MRAHSDAVLVDFINLHLQVLREDIWTLNGFGQPNPTVVYAYMVLLQVSLRKTKLHLPCCCAICYFTAVQLLLKCLHSV